jgi:hyaluronan synthase
METLLHFFMLAVASYTVCMYVVSIFFRYYLQHLDVERDFTLVPTVSVLMSAFNEGEAVYRTIKSLRENNYPVDRLEILAYDDCSPDDTFAWIQRAAADFPNVKAVRNLKNQGKALTMLDAARASSAEFVVGVDSDCIFRKDAIRQLMACFTEPKIGAVGGRVGISNMKDSWLCEVQAVFYMASFFLMKTIENLPRKIQCLSGPLVAIRRSLYLSMQDQIESRSFFGAKITNGEDRALTQMILRAGYDTYVNTKAVCWTSAPTTIDGYLKQQLRWRRSAIGQWIDATLRLPALIHNSSLLSAFFSLGPIYVIFAWNAMIATAIVTGNFLSVIAFVLLFHIFLGPFLAGAFLWATRNNTLEKADDPIRFVFNIILASFWFPLSGMVVTMVALFTLDDGGWVTREQT